jgi:hypothetical protein
VCGFDRRPRENCHVSCLSQAPIRVGSQAPVGLGLRRLRWYRGGCFGWSTRRVLEPGWRIEWSVFRDFFGQCGKMKLAAKFWEDALRWSVQNN